MIRDRISELRRVRASSLQANPGNWRRHPKAQRDAMAGILAEIGYADALLVRELPDGTLQILDGHCRAEVTPDAEVPCLILDLNDDEAALLLASLDPLAGMAEADTEKLKALLDEVSTESNALADALDALAVENGIEPAGGGGAEEPDAAAAGKQYSVMVLCDDEATQESTLAALAAAGYNCRAVTT